jgi:hypothetical protein
MPETGGSASPGSTAGGGWADRAKALAVGIAMTLLLLGVAEMVVRVLYRSSAGVQAKYAQDYWARNERGRGHPAGPGAWPSSKRDPATGAVIYDVVYHVDEHLRRITPLSPPGPRPHFALFFGGSFTYGEGVRDDQTAPYDVGVLAPRYHPYNYGFHGSGPSDALSWLEEESLRDQVDEPTGIAVYTFIDDHVPRTVGTLRLVATWGRKKPCYEVTRDGSVVFRGTFKTARPVRDVVFRVLGWSELLARLGLDWPLRIGDTEIETTARVLARAKQVYQSQFPGQRFVVVLYPGANIYGEKLIEDLGRLHVETLDLSGLFDPKAPENVVSTRDGHPSALAYRRYAAALVERLGLAKGAAR